MVEQIKYSIAGLMAKLRRAVFYIRLRPFDQLTTEGQVNERHRRIALMALASAVSKAVSLAVALISRPLTYHYLGVERYELWVTLSTTIGMLSFADLGLGSGLLNLISKAYGSDDSQGAARAVSSAFFMLLGVSLSLGLIFCALFDLVPWTRLFNVGSALAAVELGLTLKILFGCFLANLLLSIVTRIQMGYQEGFINSLWQIAGNLLAMTGLLVAIRNEASLPFLVLALVGGPALASLLNALILFGKQRPGLLPRWSNVSWPTVLTLSRVGVFFFILQATYAVAFLSDNLIAKKILQTGSVTNYSAVASLFGIAPMILEMFLTPLWPAYSEALARRDGLWIKKTLIRSLTAAVILSGSVAIFLVVFGKPIVRVWIDPALAPPFLLFVGWGLWSVFSVAGGATAMFLNGSGAIKFQAACAAVMSVVSVCLKVYLARRIGLPGIIWGTIAAYVLFTAVPMALYVPQLLRRLRTQD